MSNSSRSSSLTRFAIAKDGNAPEKGYPSPWRTKTEQTIDENQASGPPPEHVIHQRTLGPNTQGFRRAWWLWELLAVLLSVGCMVAVVVIGFRMNGRSLGTWSLPIGINTLVSLLVTISKAAMMLPVGECISQLKWLYFAEKERRLDAFSEFDDASKGPWGAFLFLNPKKVASWPFLASLGAFITVLALAMGPFAQQTVVIRTERLADLQRASSIPVTSSFDTHTNRSDMANLVVDSRVQGAFFNGAFDLGSNFKYSCPSGNCTWPDFTSLGMCSTCQDVTKGTKVSTNITTMGDKFGNEVPEEEATWFNMNINFTTPNGLSSGLFVSHMRGMNPSISRVASNATPVVHYNNGGLVNPWTATLSEKLFYLSVVQQKGEVTDADMTGVWESKKWIDNWTATECAVNWCAKTYKNVQVLNGVMEPYTVDEVPLMPKPGQKYTPADGIKWHLMPRAEVGGGAANASTLWPLPADSLSFINTDHMAVAEFMSAMFKFDGSDFRTAFTISTRFTADTNISSIMTNITDSMTEALRTQFGDVGADGTTWKQDTIVHVEWLWLVLPLVVVFLTAVLFVVTVVVNARQRWQPLWKSSMWPLVFHGLDEWSDEEKRARRDGSLQEVRDMEEMAKGIRVTVQYNGVGTRTIQRSW